MFALRLVARVARNVVPVHDIATAYDDDTLPQFIEDKRPGRPQLVPMIKMLYGFDVYPVVVDTQDTASVYSAAAEAARASGWEVTREEAPTRFQALVTTK